MNNFLLTCLMLLGPARTDLDSNSIKEIAYVDFYIIDGFLRCGLVPVGYEIPDFWFYESVSHKHINVSGLKEFLPKFLRIVYDDLGEECPFCLSDDFKISIDGRLYTDDEELPRFTTPDYYRVLFTRENVDKVFEPVSSLGKEFFAQRNNYGTTSLQKVEYFNTYWNNCLGDYGRFCIDINERQSIVKEGQVIWRNLNPQSIEVFARGVGNDFNGAKVSREASFCLYAKFSEEYVEARKQRLRELGHSDCVVDCEAVANTEDAHHRLCWTWPSVNAAEEYAIRLTKLESMYDEILVARSFCSYDKCV